MSPKRYIPLLITMALLALIGLQGIWLFLVYEHKELELKDKTREAVLETTKRLQQEEDSKLIINNMDSLLLTENIIGSDSASPLKVIVSNIRNKIQIDTLRGATVFERNIQVKGDSSETTTILKLGNNATKQVIVHSSGGVNKNEISRLETNGIELEQLVKEAQIVAKKAETQAKGLQKKAGELQKVFLKMAMNSKQRSRNLHEMVNFEHLEKVLHEELEKRGIDLKPEILLEGGPMDVKGMTREEAVALGSFKNENWALFHTVRLPLFPDDFFGNELFIEVALGSTTNFLFKQMAGLLSLSLFITILIGVIMIYLFRRMLSQEKLHIMKNDFINNMTHELKTPIATISLAVDALNNPMVKNDEEKFRNYSAILKEENKKLNSHVERVLQLAMLDKGETMLSMEKLELKKVLENCIKTHQLQIGNMNAIVNLDVPEHIKISGDAFHLCNAFTNLLDNSLKYSKGTPQITISATKNGNSVEIHFTDNGIGIDKTEQEKIFDKFYRVQGGNLHDVKGFGLGLSYVRSIIEAHGGSIELKSELNKGSEFIIKLKAHEA
jgi:two-component system, OmpR family, phosphate regulon sensor histidine kinase PhoR